ncbi:MAG: cytochrome c oxidase subunit 3 family protein [Isosphaeraceae bacterium]
METLSPHRGEAAKAHPSSDDEAILEIQFDDLAQQAEASTLGMWLFLATEVMFFGGLITAYAVYRSSSPREIALASEHLNVPLGFFNTVVLLGSSLTMALAVRASQLRAHRQLLIYLGLTMVLGTAFLGVKAVEWTADYHEKLIPGWNFQVPEENVAEVQAEHLNPGRMQMFFVLYFFMTGLHAIHLIVGIGLVGVMAYLSYRRWFSGGGATQIEVTGLYWHFIDIVWVFLYPMLYLIDVHS